MKRWYSLILLFVIFFSLVAAGKVKAASDVMRLAEDSPPEEKSCYSLDVVFLIDQSDSMSSIRASDPENERQIAVTSMIDLLVDNALDFCPEAHHRVAVISYGSEAQIDMDLSSINPDDKEEAVAIRADLKPKVILLNLGETQPKKAFKKALEIFNGTLDPTSGGLRKKVIIFVTDGIPYDTNLDYMDFMQYVREMRDEVNLAFPFNDKKLKDDAKCWLKLQDEYLKINKAPAEERAGCLEILKDHDVKKAFAENTYIYGLFLESPTPYPKQMIEVYRDLVESHAGQLIMLKKDPTEIPTTFRKIIELLIGVEASVLDCGDFAVNPYLEKMILTFYKMSAKTNVTLTYIDEKGVTHTLTGGKASDTGGFDIIDYEGAGTANERYSFSYPFPGIWKLNADFCDGLDAYFESVEISDPSLGDITKLPAEGIPQFDKPPYFSDLTTDQHFIRYQMLDKAAVPIMNSAIPEFMVDVNVTVTDPAGEKSSYPMKWVDDMFESATPIKSPLEGEYTIDIVGTTRVRNGEPLLKPDEGPDIADVFVDTKEFFKLEGKNFRVFPVTPFVIQINKPEIDEGILSPLHGTILDPPHWPLRPESINVTASLTYRDGSPVSPGDLGKLLKNPDNALVVVFKIPPDGKETKGELKLDSATGEYNGSLDGVDQAGSYSVTVKMVGEPAKDFRPDKYSVERSFEREEGNIWHREITYKILLFILIGLVFAAIFRYFAIRTNKVKGDLVFTDGATEIARFGLYSGKNWMDLKSKTFELYPMLDLKSVRVSNKSKSAKKVKDDAITGGDYFGGGDVGDGVEAIIRTGDGRRSTVDLYPNAPTNYSDNSVAQMKYEPPVG